MSFVRILNTFYAPAVVVVVTVVHAAAAAATVSFPVAVATIVIGLIFLCCHSLLRFSFAHIYFPILSICFALFPFAVCVNVS